MADVTARPILDTDIGKQTPCFRKDAPSPYICVNVCVLVGPTYATLEVRGYGHKSKRAPDT